MITQNEIALKILNMGKDGYKNDAEGFEKLNQANDLIEKYVQEQLRLYGVMFELPDYMEVRKRIKHVVENSFEDYETVEKREYTLGFNACYNWLKIKFMKRKGN